MIEYTSPHDNSELILENDHFVSTQNKFIYQIVDGIPRFVSSENYAKAFGHEWKSHPLIQFDRITGSDISKSRLERCIGMSLDKIEGQDLLEAGSGAGRFTDLLVKAKANVHSFDLSIAVEVNKSNIGNMPNYAICQASINEIPYPDNVFDIVICIGVLQHTPSPEKSIEALYKKVKPGGKLVIDNYTYQFSYFTKLASLLRLYLKEQNPEKSMRIIRKCVKIFFPLHWAVRRFYPFQMILSRFSPIIFDYRSYPQLSKEQHYEWSILETFDILNDYYKHFRTESQIVNVLKRLGAVNIISRNTLKEKVLGNGIEATCIKPIT